MTVVIPETTSGVVEAIVAVVEPDVTKMLDASEVESSCATGEPLEIVNVLLDVTLSICDVADEAGEPSVIVVAALHLSNLLKASQSKANWD